MNTPKTDATAIGFDRILVDKEKFTVSELVEANFARSLETRCNALVAALEDIARGPLQGPEKFEQYAIHVARAALAEWRKDK